MKHKARLKRISRCIRRVHLINTFQTGKSNRIGCAFYCDDHVHFHTSGAPNGNFRENICSEDDLRSRIFGAFVVKFLACQPLLGFSNIYKMV